MIRKIATLVMFLLTASACQKSTNTTTTEGATKPAVFGEALSDAAEVDVAELLTKPESYVGKTVRINGDVIAMCHHKRDWFAVVPPDKSAHVRVLTGPVFKVPEDAIGKKAATEGSVEVVEISQETAQHFAESHKLGDPAAIIGPVKQVVVHATGAQFN